MRDKAKKRAWELAHRSGRSAAYLAWVAETREARRIPPSEMSERLAAGGEEGGQAWAEYEASLGNGMDPAAEQEILSRIRSR